ncbi:hypothetical protein P8A18_17890 [Streptomyces castrisilvae]|uniref:Uncharacterized protein n=1 Tax=Streptomyces castrisilvae TaxID=3033811 RepID=A0ABY9HLI8_9ACTN|nr:hypothetical protein [Streptomyces sp. Mut1]WLQ35186.1 hypothetical protein P8A18_17890 [Streptomyces sp. Mut1]
MIGGDWTSGTGYPGSGASPEPAGTASPAAGAHALTADTSGTCAEVSPYKTVEINGVPMTPARAYVAAGDEAGPGSAPERGRPAVSLEKAEADAARRRPPRDADVT